MKLFWRSKDKLSPAELRKKEKLPYNIAMTGVYYVDLFQCHVVLKIWLPESIENKLGEITNFLDTSISDFIRQILFLHLYGRYDLLGYVERNLFTFIDPDRVGRDVFYSFGDDLRNETTPTTHPIPVIPKPEGEPKTDGRKVYVPVQMKKDLLVLAQKKHQPISEYTRRVIITHLLGHQESFPTPPAEVEEGLLE